MIVLNCTADACNLPAWLNSVNSCKHVRANPYMFEMQAYNKHISRQNQAFYLD